LKGPPRQKTVAATRHWLDENANETSASDTSSHQATGLVPAPNPEPASRYLAGSGLALAFVFLRFRRKPQLAAAA
jgi:hypothetical protein